MINRRDLIWIALLLASPAATALAEPHVPEVRPVLLPAPPPPVPLPPLPSNPLPLQLPPSPLKPRPAEASCAKPWARSAQVAKPGVPPPAAAAEGPCPSGAK